MTNFVYTDHVLVDSSALEVIAYDAKTKKLIVELHNGVLAGYENVPEGVWNNFKAEDRLGGSVGRFWNTMVKPNYTGFSTEGLDTLLTESEHEGGAWGSNAINRPADVAVSDVEVTAAAETDAPEIDEVRPVEDVKAGADLGQRSYEITFEVVSVETKTAVVYADNDVAAEQEFYRDFDEVKVTDVRRRF